MTQGYKIIEKFLTPNIYSRPGTKLKEVKGIVIHWVANPNSTALNNRNYFENLPKTNASLPANKRRYASAHEVIGLKGEVVICLPPDEMAYHTGSDTYPVEAVKYFGSYPNNCTYGIECTHVDLNGKMSDETYETLINRAADLMKQFNLVGTEKPLWLHKEVVGWKDCHRWFVNNPNEWKKFKDEVFRRCEEMSDVLKLDEQWQWDMLLDQVKDLRTKGYLNNDEWEQKIINRTITAHELAWINTILLNRLIK